MSTRLLLCASVILALMKVTSARNLMGHIDNSASNLSSGLQTLLYLAVASIVVLMVGLIAYCITCIQGTDKRHKRRRRYAKPATIVVRPAMKNSTQQYYQHRVVRPAEQPVANDLDKYETHSLTMYIPAED